MKKKLLGFQLIKTQYKLAFREILKARDLEWENWFEMNWDRNLKEFGANFLVLDTEKSELLTIIKDSGVLSWFEEVYEQEKDIRLYYIGSGGLRKFNKKHRFKNVDSVIDYLREYYPTPSNKKTQFVIQSYKGTYNSEIVGVLEHIKKEDGGIELITNFIKQ